MAGMNADFINPFLMSATKIMQEICQTEMMMGMPVTALDDMSISAISELGNMIMGNAATIFSTKGYVIDITPPSVCHGDMTITQSYTQNICVPIHSGDEVALELNIAVIAEQ